MHLKFNRNYFLDILLRRKIQRVLRLLIFMGDDLLGYTIWLTFERGGGGRNKNNKNLVKGKFFLVPGMDKISPGKGMLLRPPLPPIHTSWENPGMWSYK